MYESSTNVFLMKTNGKCADNRVEESAFWSVPLLFACNDFVVLMTKILCVAGRRVPLDD